MFEEEKQAAAGPFEKLVEADLLQVEEVESGHHHVEQAETGPPQEELMEEDHAQEEQAMAGPAQEKLVEADHAQEELEEADLFQEEEWESSS